MNSWFWHSRGSCRSEASWPSDSITEVPFSAVPFSDVPFSAVPFGAIPFPAQPHRRRNVANLTHGPRWPLLYIGSAFTSSIFPIWRENTKNPPKKGFCGAIQKTCKNDFISNILGILEIRGRLEISETLFSKLSLHTVVWNCTSHRKQISSLLPFENKQQPKYFSFILKKQRDYQAGNESH